MRKSVLCAAAVLMLTGLAAYAQMPKGVQTRKTDAGSILADGKGMTLYTFDKDAAGKSNCNGPCAMNWPPVMATADDKPVGDYSIVTRDDGSKQWAYKGKPLYGWAKDSKPGDATGNGMGNGAWHTATP